MAGSCIGVICLVIGLEALRRASREYDAFIVRQYALANPFPISAAPRVSESDSDDKNPNTQRIAAPCAPRRFTPSLTQQLVRALLHMLQFGAAYFVCHPEGLF